MFTQALRQSIIVTYAVNVDVKDKTFSFEIALLSYMKRVCEWTLSDNKAAAILKEHLHVRFCNAFFS